MFFIVLYDITYNQIVSESVFCVSSGLYDIQPKAFFNKTVISGPKIKVNVQPDPNNPEELVVDYSKNAAFVAGEKLTGMFFILFFLSLYCPKKANLAMSGMGP